MSKNALLKKIRYTFADNGCQIQNFRRNVMKFCSLTPNWLYFIILKGRDDWLNISKDMRNLVEVPFFLDTLYKGHNVKLKFHSFCIEKEKEGTNEILNKKNSFFFEEFYDVFSKNEFCFLKFPKMTFSKKENSK